MLRVQVQQCRSIIKSRSNKKIRNIISNQRGLALSSSPSTLSFFFDKNIHVFPGQVTKLSFHLLRNRDSRTIWDTTASKFSSESPKYPQNQTSVRPPSTTAFEQRIEEIKSLLNQEEYPLGRLPCNEVRRVFSLIDPNNKALESSSNEVVLFNESTFQQRNQYIHYLRQLWNRTYKEYKHDPKLTSSLSSITTTPNVLKNIIEMSLYVPNGIQAKKTFEDWLNVYGSNIEYHPVNQDMELVMYVFFNTSKNFFRQFCITNKDDKKNKRYNDGYNASLCMENIRQMHEFHRNMKLLFNQGNMYIRPFDSYYFTRMLLVSWSQFAQILNKISPATVSISTGDVSNDNNDSAPQEDNKIGGTIGGMNIQALKKEAAENAHTLLSELRKMAKRDRDNDANPDSESYLKDSDKDMLSTFQCQCHVISAYIGDGSKDALKIALSLLDDLEDEVSNNIRNNNFSFGVKDWRAILLIYHQLMRAHSVSIKTNDKAKNNPLVVESLFYRLIQLHERLIGQEQMISLEWKHFWNVIESFYFYNKNDVHIKRKMETLLQDLNDHYVHVIPLLAKQHFFSIEYLLKQSLSDITPTQALVLKMLMTSWIEFYKDDTTVRNDKQEVTSLGVNRLCNSILDALCKTKQMKVAEEFFAYLKTAPNHILLFNTTSYLPLMTYSSAEKAEMYLNEMESSNNQYLRPNRFCYTILMQNYARKGKVQDSLRIFNEFRKKSHNLDQTSNYTNSESSKSFESDHILDPYLYSSMLNALSSNISLFQDKATQEYLEYVWNTVPLSQKNQVLYSIMMNIYAKISTKESALKALKILKDMETLHLSNTDVYPRPDNICFTNAIQALCYADEDDDDFDQFSAKMKYNKKRKDIDPTKIAEKLYLKLQHDYKKSNYDPTLKPNNLTLSSLFNVWIKHNRLDQADYFLKQLIRKHIKKNKGQTRKDNQDINDDIAAISSQSKSVLPNVFTFTMVLDAWSKCSNQRNEACEKCEQILSLMEDYFSLEDGVPNHQHYTMVVNAWSNSNAHDKALRANQVIQRMKDRLMDDNPNQDYYDSESRQREQKSRDNRSIKTTHQETFTYTSLLNACAASAKAPQNMQKEALQIAISSMKEFRPSNKANYFTYIAYIRAIKLLTKHEGSDLDNPRRYNLLKEAFHNCCEDGLLHEKVLEIFYWASGRLKKSSQKNNQEMSLFDEVTKGHVVPKGRGQRFIIDYDSLDKDWIRNL